MNTVDKETSEERGTRRWRPTLPPALRSPAFRSYWFGTLASVSGFQVLQFGQLWLVHQLTGSPLYLGYVGLANAVPAIALNLFGGVFADRVDQRRLIVVTQSVITLLIFVLATLTATGVVEVWHVLALAFVTGAVNAFDQPARQALYPHLIDRRDMMSAVALISAIWQGTRIVAPAVAGFVIAVMDTYAAFYLAGLGFLTMAVVMAFLRVPELRRAPSGKALSDMLEGLRFIRDNTVFWFLIGMTFFNSFFGMSYVMMMPVFAVDVLRVGADGQGVLLSSSGIGALMVTMWLGTVGGPKSRGLLLIGGAVMAGLSIAAFALTARFVGSFPLAVALTFLVGAFISTYMVSIMSSLQVMVPDRMRGRVMGFYGMTWSILPLGGMQAGALATVVGTPVAVAIGGLAVAAFALGPALLNGQVRGLGAQVRRAEAAHSP